jgi:creatinine amidohydrolase/Fe(II)-dependent formamide hydrolase-like protein
VVPAPPEFVPKSGVLWRATEATAESGRRFTEVAASQIVDAIRTEFGDTDA